MGELFTATVFTLSILSSFVFFIFYLMAYSSGAISLPWLVGFTILTNLILWLVSPWITDWSLRALYRARFVEPAEFQRSYPELWAFLEETCTKRGLKVPKLILIADQNPTAFCYGSYPSNARLAASEGLFKYLETEEQKAVYAHELGHIVHKDFIVMTVATTLVQLLYIAYRTFIRARSSGRGKGRGGALLIAVVSYVLYLIGTYLLLFLSRTRELLADRFSAETTRNPDALSSALVKIAYGIAAETDDDQAKELLAQTRSLGISDYKMDNSTGSAFKLMMPKTNEVSGKEITKVLLYDVVSPWAKLSEIHSTHPLTGRRIQAMCACAKEMGVETRFDFDQVMAEKGKVDFGKLYGGFFAGAAFYLFPYLVSVFAIVLLFSSPQQYPFALLALGFGILTRGFYMYMRPEGQAEETTAFELLEDIYANPLKGRYVKLTGTVIGKGAAGSSLGEDVQMQDRSGVLVYLNYESWIPLFGNLIFGMTKAYGRR
jgi:Zn-dependent protease with chaperone function